GPMPQLVKKRRSGWAVLATGALVASLLAVGASPAGAQDYSARADNKALTSACVGDALGDQMFTDVSDMHTFKDAINCIAYYGVTNGTGDGSTYSPNQDVIRAEMAVFIARAAGAAGVDLGDAMDAGFTDIGDVWAEAQDAINRLASKGMIASGGAYRPGDAVTRAEMASFLIGLLVKASPDVSTSSAGALQLAGATPGSVTMSSAWNWFGDARATVPAANDAEISALYELGVTDGASAAAVQDPTKAPLDVNYEPGGTVNRGEMAAFITRALAHTSVRPAGVSAQYDGSDVVLSVRDDMFQPMSNVLVDAFLTDTGAVDLAFRANDTCGEVSKLGGGQHLCEVDGADPLTGGDGDASVAHTVPRGGTTVWAWTGDTGDTVGSGTDPYRVVIPYEAGLRLASQAKFTTDNVGKAHMGTSVVYTLQLEDGDGAVTSGSDGRNAAKYSGVQRTYAYDTATSAFSTTALSVMPVSLTTDSDGKATVTFSAPADPDRTTKGDKFRVTLTLAAGDNAPTGFVDAMGGTLDLTAEATIAVVFSTQAGVTAFTAHSGATPATSSDITVSVKAASGYLGAAARGASNRATVTVTDQYGDPITGVKVTLTSSDGTTTDGATPPVITPGKSTLMATTSGPAPRELAVGRDGSFSFGYVFTSSVADTETLTGSLVGYDHDGDGCSAAQIDESGHRCQDVDPNTIGDQPGTAPITVVGATPAVVQWATAATANDTTGQIVRAVDTDTNTIFVSGTVATDDPVADSVRVLYYDSNDRFNITGQGASTYAGFERALKVGATLAWEFDTSAVTGTRKVNEYTLTPAS
ncbi:MAG: S-layer homology domain-containing protein, partial [Acidimicrobiaceae bacterium]|nr:S-layer homology domain-containing protein [Acidimicrobiaceae bacterium]